MEKVKAPSSLRDFKHELVNSLSGLKSVHIALNSEGKVREADHLLVAIIEKLEKLKTEVQEKENNVE